MFLFLMVLLTLAVFQIFQRNVAGAAPMWVDIMLRHLTFAIGLLGASLAVHAQKQIQVDALIRLLPTRPRLILRLVVGIAPIVVCVILVDIGLRQRTMELEFPQPLFLGVTSADSILVIPIAFGLMTVHLVLRWLFDCSLLFFPPESQTTRSTE